LTVNPNRSISNHTVLRAAVVDRASRSSANVRSGCAVIRAASRCSCPALNGWPTTSNRAHGKPAMPTSLELEALDLGYRLVVT
jgi:hypothetical protein